MWGDLCPWKSDADRRTNHAVLLSRTEEFPGGILVQWDDTGEKLPIPMRGSEGLYSS